MSTYLEDCMTLLSKELGDYWASASTSAGATTKDTIVDTALKAKADDWITDECYTRITETDDDSENDERKILKLDNDTGTLTTFAHTEQIPTTCDYEIHRLFTASEKRLSLIHGAKAGFPFIFKQVRDESKTVGNWLRNGDQEEWAETSYADYWQVSDATATKNTTAPYYYRGSTSCQLSGSSGYYYQSNTEVPDLMDLAGKNVTFKAKGYSSEASSLRLTIYDGTTTTNSDYHAGDNKEATLSVSATIAASPSEVSFRVYYTTGATVYVDDLRVTGPTRDKLYIGGLGLALHKPHKISQSPDSSINKEPWKLLRDYEIDGDGYLYIPNASGGYRLRIEGIGYLDFLKTGAVSTEWDAEIALDSPQTEILVAEAAIYLCNQKIVPNDTSGTAQQWMAARAYWQGELRARRARFGMVTPSATISWGI